MKKCILISLLALLSLNMVAGNGKKETKELTRRFDKCNDFWNPKVEDIREELKAKNYRWTHMTYEQQNQNWGLKYLIEELEERKEKFKNAKNYCIANGLKESKEKYAHLL